MKTREEQILEQLTELCRVNEYANFEISVPASTDDGPGILCFENKSYPLDELNLTLHDIERLERLDKISIVRKFRFKELSQNEISRTCYSLFVPTNSEIVYDSPSSQKWRPVTFVALFGGTAMCIVSIIMFYTKTAIVGYDTHYGGGYGYHTLSAPGMLLIGLGILVFGLVMVPWRRKR
ncbi:MAG: hypothetical protein HWE22_14900 [Flavobacteriales bacterium]|nr:hypothetical protein [Flavobacteriales bacterium]